MLYLGLKVDRRFANPSIAVEDVLAAQAHATLVALPAALVAGTALMLSVWMAGSWWWALAGALLAGALVAALHGAPRLLARRPLVQRTVEALMASVRYARAQRAETLAVFQKYFKLDDPVELDLTYERIVQQILQPAPYPAVEQFTETLPRAVRHGGCEFYGLRTDSREGMSGEEDAAAGSSGHGTSSGT